MTKINKFNITDDVFEFLKCRCGYCGKISKNYNNNFCSMMCKALYFKKMNETRLGIVNIKTKRRKIHIYDLSDILNEENLKAMIEESEKNIDTRMNKMMR